MPAMSLPVGDEQGWAEVFRGPGPGPGLHLLFALTPGRLGEGSAPCLQLLTSGRWGEWGRTRAY